jgi:uncharacterized phage protein (TIGR01671 family)
MRIIKFRGKSLATGEWLYGSHFNDGAEDYILPNLPSGAIDYEMYQVDQNTVGQFTGLRDKNGKEIYEGDIIKYFMDTDFDDMMPIDYDEYTSVIHSTDGINEMVTDDGFSILGIASQSHRPIIIGNIYDNPELIKQ